MSALQGQAGHDLLCPGHTHWQCCACHHQTTLRAVTVFAHTRLLRTTWLLSLYFLTHTKTNMASLELMRHLGVFYLPAWRLKHKLMQAMQTREGARRPGGLVIQIDDTYIGRVLNPGKANRGSKNKRPFFMALSTDAKGRLGMAVMKSVSGLTKSALGEWFAQHREPGTEVYSDGLGAFRAAGIGIVAMHIPSLFPVGAWPPPPRPRGARWGNVVLGNVKWVLVGNYHSFGLFQYSERYLVEAQYRFTRCLDPKALLWRLLVPAARCRPWSERALRNVPVFAC